LEAAQTAEQKETIKWQVVEGKTLTAVYKKETADSAPGKELWRFVKCIECNLWKINENGSLVGPANTNWAITQRKLAPGDRCLLQHDMGTYPAEYPGFLSHQPYAVTLY
jgi:hypothetical protein